MKSAVITGVSSGIGRGAAKVLIQHGWHVFGSVRRAEDGENLVREFGSNFTPLPFDVTDEAAIQRAAALVGAQLGGRRLDGLVNNAGISHNAALTDISLADVRRVIEVNFFGPLMVTRAFAPLLGTDTKRSGTPGRVVNISSIAGRHAVPFSGAYSSSKFALEAMSETFRREFMLFGIDVIIIGPGAVKTEMWDKNEQKDNSIYSKSPYFSALQKFDQWGIENGRTNAHTPEQQGQAILHALTTKNPKPRYAAVAKPFLNWTLLNMIPKRTLDRFIAKNAGLTPGSK